MFMKRILSVLLAVLMVFSTTVMAAPVSVSTVETAQEFTAEDTGSVGELEAEKIIKPGINMLTGTTEPLTGETTTDDALNALFSLDLASKNVTFTVDNDPLNEKGKTMKWNVPANVGSYPIMTFSIGNTLSQLVGHNSVHVSFDHSKVVNGITEDNYTPSNNFWIMNGGEIVKNAVSRANLGWEKFDELIDYTQGGKFQSPNAFVLEAEVRETNQIETNIYLDNMYVVPAYEFKFYSKDGNKLLSTKYEVFDDQGKIITTYKPQAGLYGGYYVTGWSLTKGGEKVDTVNLENKNLVFYATEMLEPFSVHQEGVLDEKGATALLIPEVIDTLKDVITPSRGQWTIKDEEIATIVKNSDGSATLTAVKDGRTTATFTFGEIVVDYTVNVVFPYEINVDDVVTDASYDEINPAAYTAMVVRLNDTQVGDIYEFYYVAGENDMGTIEIEATTTQARDYYVDLTKLDYWAEGEGLMMQFAGGATVEKITLYSTFDSGFSFEIASDSSYLSFPGDEAEISVKFKTLLEAVYDEGYELTISDPDDVVSEKIYDDGTILLRANIATGFVTVTVTSDEDPSYSVSKKIYVDVDSSKFGHYHNFLGKTEIDSEEMAVYGDTTATLGEDVLTLTRNATEDSVGGLNVYGTVNADQKYLVVKTKDTTSSMKVYYHYDSSETDEANTDISNGVSAGSEEKIYAFEFTNIPEDAETINYYVLQISDKESVDLIYMYTTSEMPEEIIEDTIIYTWDFTNTSFNALQGQKLAVFNGETMKATMAYAEIDGAVKAVQVSDGKLADGTEVIRLSTVNGSHGSLMPKTYPDVALKDYPYMWFKYRSNGSEKAYVYLKDEDQGGSTEGWESLAISFPESEEWTTKVVCLPEHGYLESLNTTFKSMMFQYAGKTVLTNVKQDATGYYVDKDYTYSEQTWVEFDEICIANYDPFAEEEEKEVELNIAVTLTPSADAITTDAGSITITPTVFANKPISTHDVTWSLNNGNAKITENDDGTVTLTASTNGEVTVTATSKEDSAFSGSVTISISGQRKKLAAYEFNYFAVGNSFLTHGGTTQYQVWAGPEKTEIGMAASKDELDYYHRIQYYLTQGFNCTISATRTSGYAVESCTVKDTITTAEQARETLENNVGFIALREEIIKKKPNLITVQLSENFKGKGVIETTFYDVVYGMINEARPINSVVVVITPFMTGTRIETIKTYAAKYGFYVADLSYVPSYDVVDPARRYVEKNGKIYDRGSSGWKYNPYLAWEQYCEYDDWLADGRAQSDFRSHPGDLGMDEIAKRAYEQFEAVIPAFLDAEYVYVPDTIEISGGDAITEAGGTLDLDVIVDPEDSSTEVIWSIDDEKIAKIDENGVVTARIDGVVTVTATCAYDSTLVAEKTITISGQPDVYTLEYAAGTTDAVESLPEKDDYALGEYTLSTLQPSRNGYKFLGWSLTENGEITATVNVTEDTTVYAVWALAEGWHFDEDGNNEGITFGGFNVAIEGGIGSVLSYGDGIIISDNTLLLNSDNYDKLNVRMELLNTEETDLSLVLEITTADKKYTYSKDIEQTGVQYNYSFDISDVEGTITGFALKPSAKECKANVDWIEFERVSLDKDAQVDKVNVIGDYTVNGNGYTYTIDSLIVSDDVTITLENGNFVIDEIVGNGTVVTNGNLTYTGEEELAGYVSLTLPEKTDAENVRFIVIDGVHYEFDGDVYGFIINDGKTKVVQLVEKTDKAAVTTVKTNYYLVSQAGCEELEFFEDGIDNVNEVSLRVKDPVGVRFMAGILNTAKSNASVTEYGFVIALERDLLRAKAALTLDFEKIATGSAYISGDTDIVYYSNATTTFFTGVLHGIPEDSYGVRLVSRTFTKLVVDGEEYVVYGEPMTASAYQVAKQLEGDTSLDEASKAIVDDIIDKAENGKDLGFDYGDLL